MTTETAAGAYGSARPYRVVEAHRVSWDTFNLVLDPVHSPESDQGSVHFEPGQFNMLQIRGLPEDGEIPFATTHAPGRKHGVMHVVRAPGKLSKALENLKTGDMLEVRGPLGSSWPMEHLKGKDLVIVADGNGLASLRPVLYFALHNRASYGRISLLFSTRSPADVMGNSEFEFWRKQGGIRIEVVLDGNPKGWQEHAESVACLMEDFRPDPERTAALLCGPEHLMQRMVRKFAEMGLSEDRIYITLERTLRCKRGACQVCQTKTEFTCREAQVYPYPQIRKLFSMNWEIQN